MNIQKLAQKAIHTKPRWASGENVTIWKSATKSVFLSRNSQDQIVCRVRVGNKVLKPSWVVANFLSYWKFNTRECEYKSFAAQVKAAISGQMLLGI